MTSAWSRDLPEAEDESDGNREYDDHVDEARAHKISRQHPVPLARVLQQMMERVAMYLLLSLSLSLSFARLTLTDGGSKRRFRLASLPNKMNEITLIRLNGERLNYAESENKRTPARRIN